MPRFGGAFLCEARGQSRAFCRIVLVSAKEAGGLRHRLAAGEFVRQVTDIHLGPGRT